MKKMLCFAVTLVAMSFVPVQPVFAVRDFSNADIRGSFGFEFDGFVTTPTGMAPASAVGRFVGDGAGTIFNGVRTLVVGGIVTHQTFRCTYSVDPEGTGTATCQVRTDGVLSTEHYDFVIVDNRNEAVFVATDTGVTIGGRSKRQRSR